jgi:hypothetical protein
VADSNQSAWTSAFRRFPTARGREHRRDGAEAPD